MKIFVGSESTLHYFLADPVADNYSVPVGKFEGVFEPNSALSSAEPITDVLALPEDVEFDEEGRRNLSIIDNPIQEMCILVYLQEKY
jgi:hypothetical protein